MSLSKLYLNQTPLVAVSIGTDMTFNPQIVDTVECFGKAILAALCVWDHVMLEQPIMSMFQPSSC